MRLLSSGEAVRHTTRPSTQAPAPAARDPPQPRPGCRQYQHRRDHRSPETAPRPPRTELLTAARHRDPSPVRIPPRPENAAAGAPLYTDQQTQAGISRRTQYRHHRVQLPSLIIPRYPKPSWTPLPPSGPPRDDVFLPRVQRPQDARALSYAPP